MTEREASDEAKRRWGSSGVARLRTRMSHKEVVRPGRLAPYRYLVGNGRLGAECTVLGQGDSWAEAFADARPKAPPSAG